MSCDPSAACFSSSAYRFPQRHSARGEPEEHQLITASKQETTNTRPGQRDSTKQQQTRQQCSNPTQQKRWMGGGAIYECGTRLPDITFGQRKVEWVQLNLLQPEVQLHTGGHVAAVSFLQLRVEPQTTTCSPPFLAACFQRAAADCMWFLTASVVLNICCAHSHCYFFSSWWQLYNKLLTNSLRSLAETGAGGGLEQVSTPVRLCFGAALWDVFLTTSPLEI